ncbi:MAG: M6 family metalloprotease domain-containing protein, partial [Gemmatimonadota bacterium]
MDRRINVFTALLGAFLLASLPIRSLPAQQQRARPGQFEVLGLDFSPDGAWRKRTHQIRQARSAMLQSRSFSALNATGPSASRVSGTYNVPVVLISYSNVPAAFSTPQYQDLLFNPAPVAHPYSVKSYYEQMSRGFVTMNGTVFNPVTVSHINSYYEDGCRGIGLDAMGRSQACGHPGFSGTSIQFRDLLIESLTLLNGTVNWGLFDNDGPDAIPNSGDDDGFVDFVSFVQPEVDGACGAVAVWAHRFTISGVSGGTNFVTTTPRAGSGFIQIRDYTIQSGQGGDGGCSAGQLMPIGTIAHETGHAFGLPDLYDTSGNTEGIGEWGIMGSGNYARPYSPSSYDAWALTQMGWVTVDTLGTSQTVSLEPVQTSDTVFYVGIPTSDEFFLLENRDSLLNDTAMMNVAFSRKKSPGLLIWHIDQSVVDGGLPSNSVNAGFVQGVALMQADGLNNLRASPFNRGDAGDSYPGTTTNRRFAFSSNPSSTLNSGGGYTGFVLDSIFRVASGIPGVPSPVVFRFLRRTRSVITTNRSGANVKVNTVSTTRFDDVIAPGDIVSVDVTTPQTIASGRTQLTFLSWSDAGATAHTFAGNVTPDTLVASFSANHKLNLVSGPVNGTVTSDISGNPNLVTGVFLQEGIPVTLTATPTGTNTFVRWQGDTTTTNTTLVLPMGRPYSLTAIFSGAVVVATNDAVNALLGVACAQSPCLSTTQMNFLDQSGNNDGLYNLGDFLAYADRSGLNPSSEI